MITFNELKRLAKKNITELEEIKIGVLGDTATQFLSQAVKGYSVEKNMNFEIFEADYNQIEAQVMDESSELYEFAPGYIIIYMSVEKMYDAFCKLEIKQRGQFGEDYYNKIKNNWDNINGRIKCNILQFNFAELYDGVFGNYANKVQASFLYQVRKLNILLMDGVQQYKNIFTVDLSIIQNSYGRNITFNDKYYYSARMSLSVEILPYIAKQVIDIIDSLKGRIKKCAVLDLDNTLWGGVIGDDGLNNIQIGELGIGRAFSDLQRWLKQLKERGIILAVCSKNNEGTAKEPFEKHPDMILKLDDISVFVANWDDKASNIRYIQQVLNIGMDSMVFLDDNPFERELVKEMIPEITVPELPEDPAEYLKFLKELNLFETVSYSEEDEKRTFQYQAEIGRKTLEKSFSSIDDYLKGLEMKAEVCEFDEFHYPRIAQLSQRSNQFNLRTIRYTESDIEAIAKSDKYFTIYFTLEDKFGEHGLISVVILEKKDSETLFIDTWFMSCRVLKRGMEEFIINTIVDKAKENGFLRVIGEYIKTQKNEMVKNIYEKMGFVKVSDNEFEVIIETFNKNKAFIRRK